MAEFLGDIAFMLEVFALATGLLIYHFGIKEKSKLIKLAAVILILAGIFGMVCTGYYWFEYYSQGAFDTAYPVMQHMK